MQPAEKLQFYYLSFIGGQLYEFTFKPIDFIVNASSQSLAVIRTASSAERATATANRAVARDNTLIMPKLVFGTEISIKLNSIDGGVGTRARVQI